MSLLRRTFREWWQVPRRASERIEHRTVSFLELFYDLVYVVLIAEVAHVLAGHADLAGFGRFVFLFLIVWWTWLNGTVYHDLHGNNDLRTRVFTFLQMIFVAAMAVFAHDALGETSVGFALAYAGFYLIFAFLWWRTGVYDPDHSPISRTYAGVFLASAFLVIVSVTLPTPLRFYIWALSLGVSLMLPFFNAWQARTNADIRAQLDQAYTVSVSAVERFGLFMIIVLGEVIAGVIRGLQGVHHLDWSTGITALLGMLIAIGIWWIYFDLISHHQPKAGRNTATGWLNLHLPLAMGITAVGAAVLNVIEHAGTQLPGEVRWLLVGAVAVVLFSIALLLRTIERTAAERRIDRVGGIIIAVSGGVCVLLGFSNLETLPLLGVLVAVVLIPIGAGLWVWIKTLDEGDVARH